MKRQLNLKQLRISRHFSGREIASALGVSYDRYRLWESDPATMRMPELIAVARLLDVPLGEFLVCVGT